MSSNPLIALWAQAAADSREASTDRRDRVLAHPDLVKRMKGPPLSMKDAERWTGWIPPRAQPEETCGGCGAALDEMAP